MNLPTTITPDVIANLVAVLLDDEAVLVVHRGGVMRHECQTSDDAYRLKTTILQAHMAGNN